MPRKLNARAKHTDPMVPIPLPGVAVVPANWQTAVGASDQRTSVVLTVAAFGLSGSVSAGSSRSADRSSGKPRR